MQLKSLLVSSLIAAVCPAAAIAAPEPTLAPRHDKHNDHDSSSYINYTTVGGFFLQDEATTVPGTFDYVRAVCPISK